jgi:hypothetical protein
MIPVTEFLKRLPADAKEERALVEAAFGIPVTLREKGNEIRSNTRLSDLGKQEKLKELALGSPAAHMRQIRSRAAAMTANVKNLRLALKPPSPDRADLFGEMQRQEQRTFLRSLPPVERLRLVMEDPAMTEAVLHAAPALSGLSTEQLDAVKDKYLESTFGPQLRGIEAREAVLETLNAALHIATREFLRESQLSEGDLEKAA